MSYSVGQVAGMTGVTVRTLHHYDEIGLLSPSARTAAGYRRYSEADLDRMQHVLGYRALGFPLERIATLLDEPNANRIGHLRRQRELLTRRIEHMQQMVAALERMMEAEEMGIKLTPEERFEVWGDFDPDQYAAEAEERWGDSDAFCQSQARTSSYTKEDWLTIKQESEAISQRLVTAMQSGVPTTSAEAMDLAEQHRRHISRWFYDCSYEIHRGLGQMYVDDPQFTATYEAIAPGLAAYLRDAIIANADRNA